MTIRNATPDDAALFVRVYELASHGLAPYLWRKTVGPEGDANEYALELNRRRIEERPAGSVLVVEVQGEPAGGITTYEIGPEPEPIDEDTDPNVATLIELENLVPGTRYINAVAVLPEYRGRGLGTKLIGRAESLAGTVGTSLIVEDINEDAQRLCERLGYAVIATRPFQADGWESDVSEYRLMLKADE